jgi:Ni/Co efflux regulator RcnB
MKFKSAVAAVLAVSLASSGFVFAQGRGDREDRGRNERAERGNDRDNDRRPEQREYNGRGPDGRGPPGQRKKEERREAREGRGAGPNHSYYRGDRLPMEYRHQNYVVNDWRSHQLSAPPRGYHWVQTGGDYVLVAIATGVILQLLLGN